MSSSFANPASPLRENATCEASFSISGSIGKKFYVKILAYEFNGREIYPIKIVCPYLKKLNKDKRLCMCHMEEKAKEKGK